MNSTFQVSCWGRHELLNSAPPQSLRLMRSRFSFIGFHNILRFILGRGDLAAPDLRRAGLLIHHLACAVLPCEFQLN